jgi:hypothetical protein
LQKRQDKSAIFRELIAEVKEKQDSIAFELLLEEFIPWIKKNMHTYGLSADFPRNSEENWNAAMEGLAEAINVCDLNDDKAIAEFPGTAKFKMMDSLRELAEIHWSPISAHWESKKNVSADKHIRLDRRFEGEDGEGASYYECINLEKETDYYRQSADDDIDNRETLDYLLLDEMSFSLIEEEILLCSQQNHSPKEIAEKLCVDLAIVKSTLKEFKEISPEKTKKTKQTEKIEKYKELDVNDVGNFVHWFEKQAQKTRNKPILDYSDPLVQNVLLRFWGHFDNGVRMTVRKIALKEGVNIKKVETILENFEKDAKI